MSLRGPPGNEEQSGVGVSQKPGVVRRAGSRPGCRSRRPQEVSDGAWAERDHLPKWTRIKELIHLLVTAPLILSAVRKQVGFNPSSTLSACPSLIP